MRYLPLRNADRQKMLNDLGLDNQKQLFDHLPKEARDKAQFNLPDHQTEIEVENFIKRLAAKNLPASEVASFLGAGAYKHHIPATVDYLIQRGEFLTAYTPYQPEISQGTLQYLFEFQTQVATLLGTDVANASMYDGATAAAEAVMMALRITKRSKVLLSGHLHPHYAQVIQTYGKWTGFDVETLPLVTSESGIEEALIQIDDNVACVVTQCPGFLGHVYDYTPIIEACHQKNALHIGVVTEIVSMGLLQSPGTYGTDIVVAEGQSLGNPLTYGGPYLGLFACKDAYKRFMPGRLVGETKDVDGKRGYVMTLVAREQHIRREKATSNICTNSGLCALAFNAHLTLLGGTGLYQLATINHERAHKLAQALRASQVPIRILPSHFFNEFTIELPFSAKSAVDKLVENKILAGVPVSTLYPHHPDINNLLIVAATELTSDDHIRQFVDQLEGLYK